MTPHRLAINCAKNYCNRTLIVKVIVENVVACFFGDTVYYTKCLLIYHSKRKLNDLELDCSISYKSNVVQLYT